MPENQWRVFIDTNVLVAGLVSTKGASAVILDLGEAEEIRIVISQHVLIESDRVFLAKFPYLIDRFRVFIKDLAPLLLEDPKSQAVHEANKVIELGDAPILAAVKSTHIDYLVTLDTKHFETDKVQNYISTQIVTPGEFLKAFRTFWEEAG